MAEKPTAPPPPPPPMMDIGLPQTTYPNGKPPLDIRVLEWFFGGWKKSR